MSLHFYSISEEEYEDYSETIIAHTTHFTRREFINMYNESVELHEDKSKEAVVSRMCENYGFIEVVPELEIHTIDTILSDSESGLRAVYSESDIEGTDNRIRLRC